jgi:hypothetical protein
MPIGIGDRIGYLYRVVLALIVDQDHLERAGIVEIEKTTKALRNQLHFIARGNNCHNGRPGLRLVQRFRISVYRGSPKITASGNEIDPDRKAGCRYDEACYQVRSSVCALTE